MSAVAGVGPKGTTEVLTMRAPPRLPISGGNRGFLRGSARLCAPGEP